MNVLIMHHLDLHACHLPFFVVIAEVVVYVSVLLSLGIRKLPVAT